MLVSVTGRSLGPRQTATRSQGSFKSVFISEASPLYGVGRPEGELWQQQTAMATLAALAPAALAFFCAAAPVTHLAGAAWLLQQQKPSRENKHFVAFLAFPFCGGLRSGVLSMFGWVREGGS